MEKRTVAYIRVSTKDQDLDRHVASIKQYCSDNHMELRNKDIYIDKQSGKDFRRDGYQAMKRAFRKGDILIIKELDRLGRDIEMIKQEWNELLKLGVNIIVVDTPILNTNNKSDLEKTLISNIVFELLSYLAEKERLKIKQRQAKGIAAAKAKGKHLGRPKALYPKNFEKYYEQWKAGQITAKKAMELLDLKRTTFYKLVKAVKLRK